MITQTQEAPSVLQINEPLARYYRTLTSRLGQLTSADGAPLRTIGVTSSVSGEGVSTVAANLAVMEATSGGKTVLIVDAHEQNFGLARLFGCEEESSSAAADSAERFFGCVAEPTAIEGLSLVTIGAATTGRQSLAAPRRLREYLAEAREAYDVVIIDLPVATPSSLCFEWAPLLDGVLLVLEAERALAQAALQVKRRLVESQSHLVGVVLNKRPANVAL
jgi:Mrp family chromosome partitioning ATPase